MKLTILGCGASAGVPLIGCDCSVCTSDNPKNTRLRVSALFETPDGRHILVDASPDLRMQALANGFSMIDALIITHAHADHCHGIDDLRSFNYHKDAAIPLYADAHTMEELQQRFGYVFHEHKPGTIWARPSLTPHVIGGGVQSMDVAGTQVTLFPLQHGRVQSLGIRIGNIAYTTDMNALSDDVFEVLEGVDYWVVDCLRYRPSPTHAHLDLTLSWIERVKPKQAILTHMAHELDYDVLMRDLPDGVVPAYDGMVVQ